MSMPWTQNPSEAASQQIVFADDDDDEDTEGSFIVLDNSPSLAGVDAELSFTTTEIMQIKAENETLKEQMMKNTEQLRRYLDIVNTWKEEKVKAFETLKGLHDLCQKLKEENESQATEIQEYKAKIQAYNERIATLEAGAKTQEQMEQALKLQLENEIARAENKVMSAYKQFEDYKNKEKEAMKLAIVQAEQRTLSVTKQMEEERQALKTQIDQAEKLAQETCAKLEAFRTEASQKQMVLKEEVETLEAENSKMKEAIEQAEAKLQECQVGADFSMVNYPPPPSSEGAAKISLATERQSTMESNLQAAAASPQVDTATASTSSERSRPSVRDKPVSDGVKDFCEVFLRLKTVLAEKEFKADRSAPRDRLETSSSKKTSIDEATAARIEITKLQEEVLALRDLLALERSKKEEERNSSVESVATSENVNKLREEVRTLHNLLALERAKREEDSHQLEQSRDQLQQLQSAHDELRQILGPVETEAECLTQQSEALQSIVSRQYQESLDQLTARCLHAEQLLESRREPESRQAELEQEVAEMREQMTELQGQLDQERSKREAAEKDNTDLQEVINTIFEESSSHSTHPYEWEQVSNAELAAAASNGPISRDGLQDDARAAHFSGRARHGKRFGKYYLYKD